LADSGNGAAQVVQQLHAHPERFYSVTQVGITLVSLGLGAVGIVTVTKALEPVLDFVTGHLASVIPPTSAHHVALVSANVLAFLLISYLHIVGGELAPKVLAFHKPVEMSLLVARPINMLYRFMAWFIWFLNVSATALLWVFGQRQIAGHASGHFAISEEELRTILAASEAEGVLKPHETQMIHGVFDLDDRATRDLMVPRTEIVALPNTSTIGEAIGVFHESKHSRFPVYEGTIDKIVGALFIKELLGSIDLSGEPASLERPVTAIMRPPYIVPESKPISLLLARFKSSRQQMAIVADEFGGTAGLVTLEDILEEIVGDFDDESSV
jgi:CBS domain containing-hemolysin-like protein